MRPRRSSAPARRASTEQGGTSAAARRASTEPDGARSRGDGNGSESPDDTPPRTPRTGGTTDTPANGETTRSERRGRRLGGEGRADRARDDEDRARAPVPAAAGDGPRLGRGRAEERFRVDQDDRPGEDRGPRPGRRSRRRTTRSTAPASGRGTATSCPTYGSLNGFAYDGVNYINTGSAGPAHGRPRDAAQQLRVGLDRLRRLALQRGHDRDPHAGRLQEAQRRRAGLLPRREPVRAGAARRRPAARRPRGRVPQRRRRRTRSASGSTRTARRTGPRSRATWRPRTGPLRRQRSRRRARWRRSTRTLFSRSSRRRGSTDSKATSSRRAAGCSRRSWTTGRARPTPRPTRPRCSRSRSASSRSGRAGGGTRRAGCRRFARGWSSGGRPARHRETFALGKDVLAGSVDDEEARLAGREYLDRAEALAGELDAPRGVRRTTRSGGSSATR